MAKSMQEILVTNLNLSLKEVDRINNKEILGHVERKRRRSALIEIKLTLECLNELDRSTF